MVRGTEISFAPSNIKRVLKLKKDPLPDAPSYHERKANKDYRLDHILYDMCEEGAKWVYHRDGRPHYLRRSDLEPMTKGWYEFVCRSILLTTNRSGLTIERAMLIHSIIIGENINVEEIIAEQIYKTTNSSIGNGKNKRDESKESEDKQPLLNNNPNSNIYKNSPLVSTLTSTPPCPKFIGGLTSNKRKIGEALRPSTQGWTEWMIN
ncbi:hypothetical protein PIB30_094898 [Stylosanthes scabra]|uniref:Putative plant transposon protein domain-containing protein n=1 Tax=Stylosanthes scabra TaxID=79078 RepID=A0ABU6QWB0_9FABA|nr:hypothetical protein [Stylosanthes scabra]